MMILLAILGGIFLLLLFLLLMPLGVSVKYAHEKLLVEVGYIFLRFKLSPDKLTYMLEKQTEKKHDEEEKKEQEKDKKSEKKKRSAVENAEIATQLLRSAGGAWNILRRHIVFDRLRFYAVVCSEDAHATATGYAKLSNVTLTVLALLQRTFVIKKPVVLVQPDFVHTKSRYDISLRVRLRPIFAVAAGINLLWCFIAAQPKKKQNNKKVVKKHESTASRK